MSATNYYGWLPPFLNPFIGDVSGFTPRSGLVPAPTTGDTAAGKFLKADGTWAVPPGTSTGVTTVGTYGSQASNANGAVISGTSIYFQSATTSNPGMVDATTQSFAGNKSFTGSVAVALGFAVGTTASATAGRIQTTGISKFGSSSAFGSVAAHEFVWVSAVGSFIDIYLTGTMTNVSAGGAQAALEIQTIFNASSGSWSAADGVYLNPTLTMGASLTSSAMFRSVPDFSAGSGFTLASFYGFRAGVGSTAGFLGTITNQYGFYAEALAVGTNRYGAYFLAPTGGTIAIACRADNLSVGYNVTPPSSGAIISGLFAVGTSTPTTLTRFTLTAASADKYAMYASGTLNADDGSNTVGINNALTLSPTNNNKNVYGGLFFPAATPVGSNTIPLASAIDFQLIGSIGTGAVTAGYSARFFAPSVGTTKAAIYTDNISVGYSSFTPTASSIHVAGIGTFGTQTQNGTSTVTIAGSISVPTTRSDGFNYIGYNETSNAGVHRIVTANASVLNGSVIQLIHSRGSLASPSVSLQGDILGVLDFGGYGSGGAGSYNAAGAVILGIASSDWSGSQTPADMVFYTNPIGSIGNIEALRLSANGNVVCGGNNGAALATTATNGFIYLPTCAGTPTGVPTAYTGRSPMVYDTSANKIWVYNGSWRGILVV